MPLPKRKLPSLDNDLNLQSDDFNEDFEQIQDLTDEDFLPIDEQKSEIKDSEIKHIGYEEVREDKAPEKTKEKEQTDNNEKKGKIKQKQNKASEVLKKLSNNISNFDYTKLNRKHYIIIGSVFTCFILLFILLSLINKPKSNTKENNNSKHNTEKVSKNNSKIKYTFKKDVSNGIIFDVVTEKSTKINLQRLFKDNNGNIIVCESGDIEITKGSQEVFAECLNNRESSDVKNTDKKLIKDNLVEIKELKGD